MSIINDMKELDEYFGKYDIDNIVNFIIQKSDKIEPESENLFKIKNTKYAIKEVKIKGKQYIRIGKYIIPYNEEIINAWSEIRSGKKNEIMKALKNELMNFEKVELNKDVLIVNEKHRIYLDYEYGYGFDDWPMGTEDFSNPVIGCHYKGYIIEDKEILEAVEEILESFDEDVMLVKK